MGTSFNEKFDQHGAWRREFALRLRLLAQWLKEQDMLDASVEERLHQLETQVRVDKVMVAFVAEFSRGKSELINAVFFAGYGQRILPASAGRTTMCPTEMAYDPSLPPCLRLLPIETRMQPQSLMEWRMVPDRWEHTPLEVNNPKQLAQAFARVSETRRVSTDEARALGFMHGQNPDDLFTANADGGVEIPRWRHALVNIAHPLLRQGLVILDTPGLNAIGAEPELTVNLITQAQAIVFVLAADTGVTQSDLTIWREHLLDDQRDAAARLVVLNKIDTLWDALDSEEEVQAQIDKQMRDAAHILGVNPGQVMALSAQKGLLGKLSNDQALSQRSALAVFETALSQGVVERRRQLLGRQVTSAMEGLQSETARVIQIRRREIAEQSIELKGLQGKNRPVIRSMRSRIAAEQAEFDAAGTRIHAVRSVHLKLLRDIFSLLGASRLKQEIAALTGSLNQKGFKLGIRHIYGETFAHLRANLQQVQARGQEIHAMLEATFSHLNTDYGFSLRVADAPDVTGYLNELDLIERSHLQYLGVGNTWRLAQLEFAQNVVRALSTRLRRVHETALADVEAWSKSAASQLDSQLRGRRRNFVRRLEAIDRIAQASEGLDERIAEVQGRDADLQQAQQKLDELTGYLMRMAAQRPIDVADGAAGA
ncbi:MAG: dynamin family protein [Rhodoferax sp.]|uniref:dynamin family protein n=1 Tax=Rhodoferax sp. TaxID=50421 RepID=UPI001B6E624A|nr:dynamin family protein [Rhodoferax sp.]MBP9904083.1 dynamin family protein [Rhodoferax sp.]